MPTALITGVAGFVGSHIASSCLKSGFKVVGIDDLSGGYMHNIPEGVEFFRGSILDVALISTIFMQHRIDYVFHFAAFPAENLSHQLRAYTYHTNIVGSANLINQAIIHKIKCFVFASSIAVYGINKLPFNENQQPLPIDPYGISKLSIEKDLFAAKKVFDLDFISFRLHNLFGERQNYLDSSRNAVSIFMSQLINQKPLTVFGDGTQTRQFTLVDDIAPIITSSVLRKKALNKVINLGSNTSVSLNQLASHIAMVFETNVQIKHLPKRHEVQHAIALHDRAKKIFQDYNQTPIIDGLMIMKEWMVKDQTRGSKPTIPPLLEIPNQS